MLQRSSNFLRFISRRSARCISSSNARFISSTETNTTDNVEPSNKSHSKDQESSIKDNDAIKDNEDSVQYERYGPITIIGLNKTHKRNAINQQMASKISEAIANFENDDSSPVGKYLTPLSFCSFCSYGPLNIGVIHGVGGSFCSGYDIDDLQSDTLKLENMVNHEGSVVSVIVCI